MTGYQGRKAKGTRAEWKSRDYLEALGFRVLRFAGSLSEWDLIAFNKDPKDRLRPAILLIQVKTTRWPSRNEISAMHNFPAPANCEKVIHRWGPYSREPEVRCV